MFVCFNTVEILICSIWFLEQEYEILSVYQCTYSFFMFGIGKKTSYTLSKMFYIKNIVGLGLCLNVFTATVPWLYHGYTSSSHHVDGSHDSFVTFTSDLPVISHARRLKLDVWTVSARLCLDNPSHASCGLARCAELRLNVAEDVVWFLSLTCDSVSKLHKETRMQVFDFRQTARPLHMHHTENIFMFLFIFAHFKMVLLPFDACMTRVAAVS